MKSLAFITLFFAASVSAAQDINSVLMKSTFLISGPSQTGKLSYGSGFIVGKNDPNIPNRSYYVFVTAAHVLDGIAGQQMTLMLRVRNANGSYARMPVLYRLRDDFRKFYKVSSEADIAVAFIPLPARVEHEFVGTEAFSTDKQLLDMNLHPGDTLFTLGFPLFTDLNSFPVLRSGVLASFPVTPMSALTNYFMNFRVFPGNSGGPVYYDYGLRELADGGQATGAWRGILGVVIEEISSDATGANEPLDVAVVVPSYYVLAAINALGSNPDSSFTIRPVK